MGDTLREQIAAAGAGDIITFDVSVSGSTIILTGGELVINKDLIIDGDLDNDGSADITISANNNSRMINITSGVVALDRLVITNGLLSGYSGGGNEPGEAAEGGGIRNAGTLFLENSTVSNNRGTGGGGSGSSGATGAGGGGGGSGFSGVGGGNGGDGYRNGSGHISHCWWNRW